MLEIGSIVIKLLYFAYNAADFMIKSQFVTVQHLHL